MKRCFKNRHAEIIGLFLTFIFTLALTGYTFASSEIMAESPKSNQSNAPKITSIFYYFDPHDELTIEQIIEDDSLINNPGTNPTNFGPVAGFIWLKVTYNNDNNNKHQDWYLDTKNLVAYPARIYQKLNDGYVKLYSNDLAAPLKTRNFKYPYINSKINIKKTGYTEIYIHYQTNTTTHLHLNLISQESLYAEINKFHVLIGAFVASIFVLALINFLLYFSLKESHYLYYTLQEISIIFYILCHSGFLFIYLWGDDPIIIKKYIFSSMALALIFANLFAKSFLQLKENHPNLNISINTSITLFLFCLISILLVDATTLDVLFSSPFAPILPTLASILTVYPVIKTAFSERTSSNILFLSSWLSILITTGLFALQILDIITIELIDHHLWPPIGFVAEGILLAIAMALKVRETRQEKEISQFKLINIYQERIKELSEVNKLTQEKNHAVYEKTKKNIQLASATHDIQGSLYSMKLHIDSLKHASHNNPSDNHTIANEAQNLVNHIEAITSEILGNSQNEALSTQSLLLDLNSIFENIYKDTNSKAQEKNIHFSWEKTSLKIPGSKVIIKRILENLINNSIKHTQNGRILLGVRRRNSYIEIQVLDNGAGIKKENIRKIKDSFQQSNSDNTGYGLGLYIVNTLCQQNGYQLKIQSALNKGSVFSILIPL